jgi:RNA polymerase sigma-70 factor (ECF subfamily)
MSDQKAQDAQKRKAFEAEALPHMDALLRTALRLTKNQSDAEDLVQEAFTKAYRFWDKFEPGSNCRAWLFKIMTNIFINNYRSKSRSPLTANLDEIDDNYLYGQLAGADSSDNPEKDFFAKILDDDVKKAIDNLPDDFRLVAVLSFLEGFSYQEIADIADLQLGTVKSRLHRGRKLLQAELYDYAVKNGYIKSKAEQQL